MFGPQSDAERSVPTYLCFVRGLHYREESFMEAKEQEYGIAEERGPVLMGAQEERSWSVLAHLSIFLNLFTGFLGH